MLCHKERDGYVESLVADIDDLNAYESDGIRGQLLTRPADALELLFSADYSEDSRNSPGRNPGTELALAISLNAPDQARREQIMPITRRYPLSELIEQCRSYPLRKGSRITFEYVLLKGINDAWNQAVSEEYEINVGSAATSWNPACHNEYWDDGDFFKPVAKYLAGLRKTLE